MMEFESNPSKPVVKWGLCMSSPKPLLLLLVGTFDAAQGREHIHHGWICITNLDHKSLSVLWHYLNFQTTAGFGSLKYFRIREPSIQVL
jgi:hypothetical protein